MSIDRFYVEHIIKKVFVRITMAFGSKKDAGVFVRHGQQWVLGVVVPNIQVLVYACQRERYLLLTKVTNVTYEG